MLLCRIQTPSNKERRNYENAYHDWLSERNDDVDYPTVVNANIDAGAGFRTRLCPVTIIIDGKNAVLRAGLDPFLNSWSFLSS